MPPSTTPDSAVISAAPVITTTTALSVNINKVALLRNTRHLGIPSVLRAVECCLEAGASGITVHPRPDGRHIREDDVYEIAALMRDWPDREFNLEGNPLHNLMDLVRNLTARGLPLHQCTFVPDSEGQFTSDHGWKLPHDSAVLAPLIAQVKARGVRVSLFMDPEPEAMAAVQALGADRIELYVEGYARAFNDAAAAFAHAPRASDSSALEADFEKQAVINRYLQTSRAAAMVGLKVNAGHDLNQHNLREFLSAVPGVCEVSIGHALIADALEIGYTAAVKAYLQCIASAAPPSADPAVMAATSA